MTMIVGGAINHATRWHLQNGRRSCHSGDDPLPVLANAQAKARQPEVSGFCTCPASDSLGADPGPLRALSFSRQYRSVPRGNRPEDPLRPHRLKRRHKGDGRIKRQERRHRLPRQDAVGGCTSGGTGMRSEPTVSTARSQHANGTGFTAKQHPPIKWERGYRRRPFRTRAIRCYCREGAAMTDNSLHQLGAAVETECRHHFRAGGQLHRGFLLGPQFLSVILSILDDQGSSSSNAFHARALHFDHFPWPPRQRLRVNSCSRSPRRGSGCITFA